MADQATAQELYGSNAVLTNPDEGRQIEIQTSNTTQFTADIKPQGNPGAPAGETSDVTKQAEGQATVNQEVTGEPPQQPDVLDEVAQAEATMKQQLQANQEIAQDLTSKGVDFKAIETEFATTGDVGEANRAALEKAGYPKAAVDAYINGIKATADQFTNSVYKVTGGQEAFESARDFVISQGQSAINAFNAAIESGNVSQIGMVIQGIKAQMVAKNGTTNPSLMGTKGITQAAPQGFQTRAEMVTAMSDKKYGRDPVYTRKIEQQMLNTTI